MEAPNIVGINKAVERGDTVILRCVGIISSLLSRYGSRFNDVNPYSGSVLHSVVVSGATEKAPVISTGIGL